MSAGLPVKGFVLFIDPDAVEPFFDVESIELHEPRGVVVNGRGIIRGGGEGVAAGGGFGILIGVAHAVAESQRRQQYEQAQRGEEFEESHN